MRNFLDAIFDRYGRISCEVTWLRRDRGHCEAGVVVVDWLSHELCSRWRLSRSSDCAVNSFGLYMAINVDLISDGKAWWPHW